MKNTATRFVIFLCFLGGGLATSQQVWAEDPKIIVGYFSTESHETFEKKIKPLFDQFKGNCKSCEIMNLTPYDEKGDYSEKALLEKIKTPPSEVAFFLFSWNKRLNEQNKELTGLLEKRIEGGQLVISPTGHALQGEAGVSLSRTVMGQSKDVVIIGEALERERLLPQSYFGPEMLSAIRPPKDFIGQGHSPLYFAARLAGVWSKRKPQEWLQHFKTKKLTSRKIWLDTEDLLLR